MSVEEEPEDELEEELADLRREICALAHALGTMRGEIHRYLLGGGPPLATGWTDWDELRAKLRPCICGAGFKDLSFQTWRMGAGCLVWCERCSLGSPKKPVNELVVNLGHDDNRDARVFAIELWNKYVSGSAEGTEP